MTKREKIIAGCAAVGVIAAGIVCYKIGWRRGLQTSVHEFFCMHQDGMLKFFDPDTGEVIPDLLDLEKRGLIKFV